MHAPAAILAAIGLSGAATMVAGISSGAQRLRVVQWSWGALAASTFILLVSAIIYRKTYMIWTFENALAVWLLTTSIWLTARRIAEPVLKRRWQAAFAAWAHMGTIVWLGVAHSANHRPAFYAGLLVWLMLWIFSKRWFRLPVWGVQFANTLILLIIFVPIFSILYSPSEQFDIPPSPEERPYSYENARKDPARYARWMRHYWNEGTKSFSDLFGPASLYLTPNTETSFFDSRISINSKGFRGEEIPEEKGDAYRIVALGESTTFGITMEKDDQPWPERLQALIEERLDPARPVQVINAGIPGRNLKENLQRLPGKILALQPDMILSYHGYNGFLFVFDGMPAIKGGLAPPYRPRPVKLLADAEYALVMRRYRNRHDVKTDPRRGYVSSPLESKYAGLYRQLIGFAKTNRVRLAMATYSMAVNEQSPRDVVDFYRLTFMGLNWQMKANVAHTTIVEELAREHPEVLLIDTCPVLDGKHEMFTDLAHLTPEGKQQMAELFFSGIRETLERDLAGTNSASKFETPGLVVNDSLPL
jgi:lysophospholipase L1-like esterase